MSFQVKQMGPTNDPCNVEAHHLYGWQRRRLKICPKRTPEIST